MRSAQGAGTKLRIIRVAADLFHKQGVRTTSPDEVIEASGTGKGRFYHYFKNKEGLVHEVLQTHLEAIRTAPVNYEINSWPDLEQWCLAHLELQRSFNMTRGCPIGTVGNEVTENDALIRQDLSLIFEIVNNKLARFFVKEKSEGPTCAEGRRGANG
jgi:TetR/AcrR family transcriptional repressor of nem operon